MIKFLNIIMGDHYSGYRRPIELVRQMYKEGSITKEQVQEYWEACWPDHMTIFGFTAGQYVNMKLRDVSGDLYMDLMSGEVSKPMKRKEEIKRWKDENTVSVFIRNNKKSLFFHKTRR